jgi:hypothetical protein
MRGTHLSIMKVFSAAQSSSTVSNPHSDLLVCAPNGPRITGGAPRRFVERMK